MLITAFVVVQAGRSIGAVAPCGITLSAFLTHTHIHTQTRASPGFIGAADNSVGNLQQIITTLTHSDIGLVSAQDGICQCSVQLLCVAGAAVQLCRPAVHSCQHSKHSESVLTQLF